MRARHDATARYLGGRRAAKVVHQRQPAGTAGAPGVAGRPRRCAGGPHREPGPAGRRPSAAHRPSPTGSLTEVTVPRPFPVRLTVGLGPALQPRHSDNQSERRERGEEDEPEHCHHAFGPSGPSPRDAAGLATRSALEGPPSRLCARGGETKRHTPVDRRRRMRPGPVACGLRGLLLQRFAAGARRGPRGQDHCRTGLRVSRSASRPNHRPGHPRSANPPLCDRSSAGVEPCIGPSRTLKVRS